MSNTNVEFTNSAPRDAEWTAHVNLLNKYTDPDRYLRTIIQYARSGKHYPADMHVDLIEQLIEARERNAAEETKIIIFTRPDLSDEADELIKQLHWLQIAAETGGMPDLHVERILKWYVSSITSHEEKIRSELTSVKEKS